MKNCQRKWYFILEELAVDCGPSTVDKLTLPGVLVVTNLNGLYLVFGVHMDGNGPIVDQAYLHVCTKSSSADGLT